MKEVAIANAEASQRPNKHPEADWTHAVQAAIANKDVKTVSALATSAPEGTIGSPTWERAFGWLAGYRAGCSHTYVEMASDSKGAQ